MTEMKTSNQINPMTPKIPPKLHPHSRIFIDEKSHLSYH